MKHYVVVMTEEERKEALAELAPGDAIYPRLADAPVVDLEERGYPEMPTSEAVWRAHVAFYRLAVAERDRAWRTIELTRKEK